MSVKELPVEDWLQKAEESACTKQLETIRMMLDSAKEYHLEAEVIWQFCHTIRQNPDIDWGEAAWGALMEWDT